MKKLHIIFLMPLLGGVAFVLIHSFGSIRGWTVGANGWKLQIEASQAMPGRAGFGEQVAVHAAGRGGPWINLRDGHDLVTSYSAAEVAQADRLRDSLERGAARPLALAAGDFDEDGVPDLISGYSSAACSTNSSLSNGGGFLTLHRGNVDAIYPNTVDANERKAKGEFTDVPFLSPAQVFTVSQRPDFLGAGDFDADGHIDVVIAALGEQRLSWLAGDGHGQFSRANEIALTGRVTAMTVGEINRRDGLADVIVGIDWGASVSLAVDEGAGVTPAYPAQLLVFEGPNGALKHEPETIALPAQATALALGPLDESYELDLAVAAGSELVIVHGRDRRLSTGEELRARVRPAEITRHAVPFGIAAVAIGDFTGDELAEVALLSPDGAVHVLERPPDKTLRRENMVSPGGRSDSTWRLSETGVSISARCERQRSCALIKAKISSGQPNDDLLIVDSEARQINIVTRLSVGASQSANDGLSPKTFSLQTEDEPVAMLPMRLNADALSDLVVLKSGGMSPLTVMFTASVHTFTVNSVADLRDINPGNGICEAGNGLCTFKAAIDEANASAGADTIDFDIASAARPDGATNVSSITDTVTIDGTSQGRVALIGWGLNFTGPSENSVIRGVRMNNVSLINMGSNIVENCWAGLNQTGTGLEGGSSISIGSFFLGMSTPNNTIGGSTAAARNVIAGIIIVDTASSGQTVQGNYVGTDVNGTARLGGGVSLNVTTSGLPGSTVKGNVIADGQVYVGGASLVQGNLIGVDATGQNALGFQVELFIAGPNTTVGGTSEELGNTIVSQSGECVLIHGSTGASDTLVQGNFIGTDKFGARRLVTGSADGIVISASSRNTIGGTVAAARNVIVASNVVGGTRGAGISIESQSPSDNLVLGNHIGVDFTGAIALGGAQEGVRISGGTPANNRIGGTAASERNIIGGFGQDTTSTYRAIDVREGNGNKVIGNFVGTDATGTRNLGNRGDGIRVLGSNSVVGGIEDGAGNTVAFNTGNGVVVTAGNPVRRNSIYSNGQKGIVSVASPFPAIPNLTVNANGSAQGTLSSTPSTTFIIEFFTNTACDPSGFGEGERFLNETSVTTDASGNANIPVPQVARLTATSTSPANTTSEFSRCVTPTNLPAQISLDPTQLSFDATVGQGSPAPKTVTLTNTGGGTLNWQGATATASGGNWLSVMPPSGSLVAGQSTTLTISIDSSALLSDIYTGTITITSADATNSPQKVDVTLLVGCPAGSTAGSAAGQAPLAPSCLDVLDLSNPIPDPAPVMGFISVQDVLNNGLKATVTYRLATRKSADLVLRVFDQAGNRRGSSAIKSITRSDPLPNPISEEFVIPGGSIDLGTVGGVEAQTLTMYALLIDPLNGTVIARSREFIYTLVKDDSIDILNPKVNNANPDNVTIGEEGQIEFQCDVQYQLVSDPFGGRIVLSAFDVTTSSNPNLAIASVGRPVTATAQPKTEASLKLSFRIPAGSLKVNIPAIRIEAKLEYAVVPNPSLPFRDTLEFSPRSWLTINEATANGTVVYPQSSGGFPAFGDGRVSLNLRATYRLSDQNGGRIVVTVSEQLTAGTRIVRANEIFPVNFTGPNNASVNPFLVFPVTYRALDGLFVEVSLLRSNGGKECERDFAFKLSGFAKADYAFQGSRAGGPSRPSESLRGNETAVTTSAVPALTDLINPGTSTPNAFVTDTVDGASTTVLSFPYNNGLALSPTTDIIANDIYTVVMLLKFDEANKARRILDFKNGASNGGLYADASDRLDFLGIANGTSAVIPASTYVQVALSRDADKTVTGYVNGAQQFQFTDTNNDAVIDANNTLRFFQDNLSGGSTGEASAGSVARIRLYERALAASEIAALDREPSTAEFSAASYMVNEAAGFATITVTRAGYLTLPASVDYITLDDTANHNYDYTFTTGTLTFAPGETTKSFQVSVTDNAFVDGNRDVVLLLINPIGVVLENQGLAVLTITDNETALPQFQFQTAHYSIGEGDGHVTITVTRSGDTSGAATVEYRTQDADTFSFGCRDVVNNMGSAFARCDFATVVGTLNFAAGETMKTLDIPVINDSYHEGNEIFEVFLSNSTGAIVGSLWTATVTIVDNDGTDGFNPILQTDNSGIAFFVRQHYLDFLGREPEPGEPWSAILRGCADQFNIDPNSPSAGCDRITVSGAFFGSPEFKDKGFYVIDFYRVAFGRLPQYSEFVTDLASLVGTTAQEVFARRASFANNFLQRPEFASIAALPNSNYVMTLMAGTNGQNYNLTSITTIDPDNPDGITKVTLTTTDLINRLNANTLTKAQVLRAIVQSDEIINIEAVSTFVASQYYGYLRRTPDTAGFNAWVNYLNTHPADFRTMVNGFMNSIEYRLRFGPA
jgi:Calx-beta domain/Concanavalin A-like lectin/glucanases superfamily/Viral BACON domain/FG-GAP-like repeat